MTIQLEEISVGDQVGLRDRNANVVRGVVIRRGVMLAITAFGVPIEFARSTPVAITALVGVTVIEHTPTIFGSGAA